MHDNERQAVEEREKALVPLNKILAEDIGKGEAAINEWLLSTTDNRIDLETVKAWAGAVPIVGNVIALIDAIGDIIRLSKSQSQDPLDWVSLGINLIGVVPVPPTMAVARVTLRPVLFLTRLELKKNIKGDIAAAVITVITGHVAASLMGEIEKYVEQAQAEIPGILKKSADTGQQALLSLANTIEAIAKGEIDTSKLRREVRESAKAIYNANQQTSWWSAAATGIKATANTITSSAKLGATEVGKQVLSHSGGFFLYLVEPHTKTLRLLADAVHKQLNALAEPTTQHSIAWIISQLHTGLSKKPNRRRASANTPTHSTGIARHKGNEARVETVSNEVPPQNDPNCVLNRVCPGTTKSISYARGTETLSHVDFELPGAFPIIWARTYRSSLDAYDQSAQGARWMTPFSMRFDVTENNLLYHGSDGRTHSYPLPQVEKNHYDAIEKTILIRTSLNTITLARGHRSQEHYQLIGQTFRLIGINLRGGARLALHYEHPYAGEGQLSDLITYQGDTLHRHVHVSLNKDGHIQTLWLMQDGQHVRKLASYDYNEHGDLASAHDENSAHWEYQYQNHLIIRYTDRSGRGTNLEWQGDRADAKAVREWADDGSYDTRLTWDKHIRLTVVTDALGHETKHYYDYLGYTYRIIYPDGNEEWLFRDDEENVTQHIHTDGSIDHYAYDDRGNLLQHIRPDGSAVHYAYDDLDQCFKTRDAEGGLWKYDYDQRGNIIETLDPLENKTLYTYNGDNLPVAMIDASGGEKKLAYNQDGQLTSYTDCSGKTTQWKYDALGQLAKLINAAGEVIEYHYEAGHLSSLVYPDKTRDRFEYDAEGRLLSYVDALHRRTTWTYNEAGLIQQRLNPDASTLHYHWDKLGQLVRLRNENNSEASFKYDPVGRLVMETGFDKQITDYFYDNSSELPTRRLDGDRITHFEYDPMGRLVESSAGERGGKVWETETFAYDGNGRLLLAENKDCKLQWFYDLAGNNTREHQHFKYMQQPKVAVFTHEYDALNLRIATTRPDGHRVSWLTYGSGHLLGLKFDDRELLNYQRDDLHREVGREQGNGLVQRQTWTPNGQLLEQTLAHRGATKRIAVRSYRYDEAGQLTYINDLNRGDLRYRYDPVGRLLEATLNYDKEHFAFDPASNLLDPQAPPGPNPHSPRKITDNVLRSYCGTQYRYDERGNLLERIENGKAGHFTWDLYNRLRRYEDDRLIVDFAYDALGRRFYKNSRSKYRDRPQTGPVWNENARRQRDEELGCGFTWFTWEGDTLATECRDREERGGSTTHYVFEPGTFVPVAQAVINSTLELIPQPTYGDHYNIDRDPVWLHRPTQGPINTFAWYQCDQLSTPIELTAEDGQIAWTASYKAWGLAEEKRSEQAQRAEILNPLRFQGQYVDMETGLHYNRYRYYDPHAGRFIGKDPIGLAGGLNFYCYCPSPTQWVDPLGLAGRNLPKPWIPPGDSKQGWQHIDERHISGTNTQKGPGDLFAPGTTQLQLQAACECLVKQGTRISDPKRTMQIYERKMKLNGQRDRIRGVFDASDNNRVITVFPVRSE